MRNQQIVHAYRHLYRHGLRAVQFSKPARYTLRDRLRLAFRKSSPADFEPCKIANTIEFLRHATAESGLEHRIVKNLLFVWWNQERGVRFKVRGKVYVPARAPAIFPTLDVLFPCIGLH
jgi:hypothetical protein